MNKKIIILVFAIQLIAVLSTNAQYVSPTATTYVNAYATVTNITGKVVTLSNIDQTNHTFINGENIIIMQMQDDVIGSNTSNNSSFGDLGLITSTGLYEVAIIQSQTATTITVQNNIANTYNISANSSVQIISFRKYGSPDYTTIANMSAKSWDGNTGGVLAIDVSGILTLAHNLSADAAGFRGGNVSGNYYPGATPCNSTSYIASSTHTNNGAKGEGVYKTSTVNYQYQRGKILNGGGGANDLVNGGGGGGGNYTSGGAGGQGYDGSAGGCSPSSGGLGGLGFSFYISASRVFMGGGGGGGQQNNSVGTSGGTGGGIILLRAKTVQTTGTCGLTISANGNASTTSGNDGAGGGGAGGSIVAQVNTWNIVSTCPITVRANGGNGGDVNYAATHGGGGAAGQGTVIYSSTQPTTNITTQTNNGTAGCNSNPCTSSASPAGGSNNNGILDNLIGPLPITLLSFDCSNNGNNSVSIKWVTLSEINNAYFCIERSKDGAIWNEIKRLYGSGDKTNISTYSLVDERPLINKSYYRLKQVDKSGEFSYSLIREVEISRAGVVILFPNPIKDILEIEFSQKTEEISIDLLNSTGQLLSNYHFNGQNSIQINLSKYEDGIYFVKITTNNEQFVRKLVKGQ